MNKLFFSFLIVVIISAWSCTHKKGIVFCGSSYLKVEDYECIAKIDYKEFLLKSDSIKAWSEADKYGITLAEYSLGDSIFEEYCTNTLVYPKEVAKNGIYGYVRIVFGVREDGSIDSVRVGRGIFPAADSVALEVVKNQPPKMWIPAHREDGSFVYSEVVVAFNFRRKSVR